MSISSLTRRVDYIGTGLVTEYDYTFRILAESHLSVTTRNTLGDETTLVLNTDYTVDGVGDATGGTITLTDALDDDFVLTIRRVLPLTQPTDIRNQGYFYPETHEDAYDRGIMIDQQQQDEIDRSLKLPDTVDPNDFDAELPGDIADNPNSVVAVNATGDGFYLVAIDANNTIPDYTDDITIVTAGKGLVVTTPNGLHTYRIAISNNGELTTEQLT